ncbi:uncharacterized protein LOC134185809 isoform X2 [Corticium candelabrum]|uniref:uncharacterized protein LOC134185809 isoform X2 n=1 Tax=Corticium candelabrum TaxID=121492 RepID=UPI002E275777|nr:uncharacterized protein LOC134185809 isoform X2 [Corticium candelabrum]
MAYIARSDSRRSYTRSSKLRSVNRCFCCLLATTSTVLLLLYGSLYVHLSNGSRIYDRIHSYYLRNSTLARVLKEVPNVDNNNRNKSLVVSTQTSRPTLWQEVGCESARPLLLCRRTKSTGSTLSLADKSVFSNISLLNVRPRSCALVGSSGRLLNRTYADDIDAHDVVIRVNDAPVHPYEKYVGKRIPDVAFINRAVARPGKCLKTVNKQTLIVQCYHQDGISKVTSSCSTHGPVFAISQHLIDTTFRIVSTYRKKHHITVVQYSTAGMYAVIFSLHLCNELDIYGFGAAKGELYQYYRNITSIGSKHNFNLEQEFLQNISDNMTTPVDVSWMGCKKVFFHP